jgi:hypothetical protein
MCVLFSSTSLAHIVKKYWEWCFNWGTIRSKLEDHDSDEIATTSCKVRLVYGMSLLYLS